MIAKLAAMAGGAMILLIVGRLTAVHLSNQGRKENEQRSEDVRRVPLRIRLKSSKKDDRGSKPAASTAEVEMDYRSYTMTRRERAFALILAGSLASFVGYLFYQNLFITMLFFLTGFFYPPVRAKQLAEKKRVELTAQFKQALYSLSSLLSAGQSVENAFRGIGKDLRMVYPQPDTPILREVERMVRRMDHGVTIEEALMDFAMRSGVEDIQNFANVFAVSKRTGGNLVEVVRRSSQIIAEKIEVKQEISIMLAQKRFESKVLGCAPLVIVAFLSLSSPDYMQPLYGNLRGILLMTVCLLALFFCLWLSGKIMDLQV
ncbi:type II secretion system F family protein [Gorillibacterium sp. CAU 1737]|uniref:type II secretion system F family protein n=1 Tax=Gorillibacterium sp. CAU 1737 TaxID=3140362 RepID=UPI003260101E